jgi:hypothetical protein
LNSHLTATLSKNYLRIWATVTSFNPFVAENCSINADVVESRDALNPASAIAVGLVAILYFINNCCMARVGERGIWLPPSPLTNTYNYSLLDWTYNEQILTVDEILSKWE